jgi:GntR family transcriptional regulator
VVKAYDELCTSGLITKRQGSGCFVTDTHSKFSSREKNRILEQRIDALLSEAHQLNINTETLFILINRRLAVIQKHSDMKKLGGDA